MTKDNPQHPNIASALAAAQSEMGKALKSSQNPHFKSKYADLASVVDGRAVVTKFIHSSGETLECAVPLIIGKHDMQGLGSAITYARRYGLMGLAGIAPEDDDGNAAAANAPKNKQPTWAETIINELPEGATEHEKARAITDALKSQWGRKKTQGELSNEWDRRAGLIKSLEQRFPDMHGEIIDAYENRMMTITGTDVAAQ